MFESWRLLQAVNPEVNSFIVELVATVMIDDLDKSCAKAEPNFDK
jgi:hypothetical protein